MTFFINLATLVFLTLSSPTPASCPHTYQELFTRGEVDNFRVRYKQKHKYGGQGRKQAL